MVDAANPVLVSTTWYYYNESGNVTRIVSNDPDPDPDLYTATRLVYAKNGQTVTFVLGESWTWNGVPQSSPANYNIPYAREFRYDGARQRYLNRELDPVELLSDNIVPLSETWSDYDGDEVYGDFTVTPGNPPTVTNARSFDPGMAKVDPWAASGSTSTKYYHSDMIGTTRFMTDSPEPPGQPTASGQVAYTAFGERIDGSGQRYGYAGAWGYQSHDDFPFLHVGARYYDPSTGRFLQRDPIGIAGGLNVYEYVRSNPLRYIDPTGLKITLRGLGKTLFMLGCGALGGLFGGTIGSLGGPQFTGPGVAVGAATAGYMGGEVYDDLTDPDNLEDLGWDLDHPPPPIRPKPICVRGCHRDPTHY